uniref:50S ribosomal protein L5 n=1 Tax=Micractinium sp. LBA 32 TaxID=1759591 RepID=A0A411IKT3_9CHLO|nr:50S ribosomal protein L5 [Micractinium sp. LBA 32]
MTLQKSKDLPVLKHNLLNTFSLALSKNYYKKIVTYDLILKQNCTSIMELPRLEKIVLNTSSKNYINDKKTLLVTLAALELISGQKPQLTYARKSVANFKIRQHQILGCKVVLRENLMYAFLDRLSRIVLPHIRDYTTKQNFTQENQKISSREKHTKKSTRFIACSFGLKNLMIFPELENHFELVENFRGMNFTFVFSHFREKDSENFTNKFTNLRLLLSGFQIPIH